MRGVAELERLGFTVQVADGGLLERKGLRLGHPRAASGQLHGLFAGRPDGRRSPVPAAARARCSSCTRSRPRPAPVREPQAAPRIQRRDVPPPGDGAAAAHQPPRPHGGARAGRRRDRVRPGEPLARADRRGRAVRERSRRPRGAGRRDRRGRAARRLPVAAGGSAGTPWALPGWTSRRSCFVEDVGRDALSDRSDAAAAAGLGRAPGGGGIVFGGNGRLRPALHEDYALEEVLLEALGGLDVPVARALERATPRTPS